MIDGQLVRGVDWSEDCLIINEDCLGSEGFWAVSGVYLRGFGAWMVFLIGKAEFHLV